jgi:hypothetical protein
MKTSKSIVDVVMVKSGPFLKEAKLGVQVLWPNISSSSSQNFTLKSCNDVNPLPSLKLLHLSSGSWKLSKGQTPAQSL